MIVTCAFIRASDLADHQRGRATDLDSVFPLTIGGRYLVVGMGLWEGVLSFLVRDDCGTPCFAPAGLFELACYVLPDSWRFRLGPGVRASGKDLWVEPCEGVWGYPELVDDPAHAGALEEREGRALAVFFRELMSLEADLAE